MLTPGDYVLATKYSDGDPGMTEKTGKCFYVLQCVSSVKVEKPIVRTTMTVAKKKPGPKPTKKATSARRK